jgi:hypothetical protein
LEAKIEHLGATAFAWKARAETAEARVQPLEQELGRMRDRYHASVEMGMEQQTRAQKAEAALLLAGEALGPFAEVASEYDRWQAKGSNTKPFHLRFAYGTAIVGLPEFRRAAEELIAIERLKEGS